MKEMDVVKEAAGAAGRRRAGGQLPADRFHLF